MNQLWIDGVRSHRANSRRDNNVISLTYGHTLVGAPARCKAANLPPLGRLLALETGLMVDAVVAGVAGEGEVALS